MINCMQDDESETSAEDTPTDQQLMCLSTAALNSATVSTKTMQLRVQIQGNSLLFLVDSGSSSCFLDHSKAELFSGKQQLNAK